MGINPLTRYFLKAFSSAYSVNLKEDTFEILYMNHEFSQVFTMNGGRRDMERFVEEHIHPDDRELLLRYIDNKYMSELLKTNSEIEFTIREIYNEAERIMRVVVIRSNEPDVAVIGFMDVTAQLQKEQKINEELESKNKAIENYRHAILSEALISFKINLTTGILETGVWVDDNHSNVPLEDILGLSVPCKYEDYIEAWANKFVDDVSKVEFRRSTSTETLMALYESGQREIAFDYSAKTISGNEKFLRRTISLAADPETGDILAYTNVKDVSEEKKKNADVLMQSRIINTLTENFIDVYMVDLETRNVSPIRVASHAINFESDYASYAPYREIIKKYINENVYEKDQAEMLMATKLDTIKNALSRTPNYYFHYRELAGEEEFHYYYMQATRLGNADDFKKIVIGFACEDEEKVKEKLLVDRLMTVEGLSKKFAYVCCVNIRKEKSEDEATPIYSNGRVERILPEWTDTKHFSKMLDLIWEKLVVDEDKDHFYAATRRETILSQITLNEFYYVNFRVLSDDELHYAQIQFSKAETGDEDIFSVIAAFHYVDSQVNEQIMQREKLESALSLAESASKAKTSFLFNMSHDIRTPMNAILGFTKIAKSHIDDIDRVRDCLDKIEVSGEQLLDLINDILEMSRIEAGKIEIINEPAVISRLLDNIGPMLKALAISKSQEFNVEFGDIKNNYVWLDAVHLNRVLVNIITNAIKYTRDGGKVFVCVNQATEPVDGVATYTFSVTDTGIGMSAEYLTHLFEEFSREKTSTESKQQGTGLGLAIAKRIVDNMGGSIDVISELDEGSTFTITLPLRIQTDEDIANNYKYADMEAIHANEEEALSGIKVLLVEDNELNQEIACDLLREIGIKVDCAEDGQFALDKVKNMYQFSDKDEYYDAILMDIQMPVMDGYTSALEIRKYEAQVNGHIPIIAMTANAFAEDKQKALDVGMDAHIAKPIDLEALKKTLISFVGKKID